MQRATKRQAEGLFCCPPLTEDRHRSAVSRVGINDHLFQLSHPSQRCRPKPRTSQSTPQHPCLRLPSSQNSVSGTLAPERACATYLPHCPVKYGRLPIWPHPRRHTTLPQRCAAACRYYQVSGPRRCWQKLRCAQHHCQAEVPLDGGPGRAADVRRGAMGRRQHHCGGYRTCPCRRAARHREEGPGTELSSGAAWKLGRS